MPRTTSLKILKKAVKEMSLFLPKISEYIMSIHCSFSQVDIPVVATSLADSHECNAGEIRDLANSYELHSMNLRLFIF